MPVEYQVIIIYAATQKHLLDIPVEDVLRFEKGLFEFIQTKYPEIPEAIRTRKSNLLTRQRSTCKSNQ